MARVHWRKALLKSCCEETPAPSSVWSAVVAPRTSAFHLAHRFLRYRAESAHSALRSPRRQLCSTLPLRRSVQPEQIYGARLRSPALASYSSLCSWLFGTGNHASFEGIRTLTCCCTE